MEERERTADTEKASVSQRERGRVRENNCERERVRKNNCERDDKKYKL